MMPIMEGSVMKSYLFIVMFMLFLGCAGFSPATVSAVDSPAATSGIETVSLNQATAEQLQVLPGVGPALAGRIVAYRNEHGPFSSPEQLTAVKGIGEAKLAKLRPQLTVD